MSWSNVEMNVIRWSEARGIIQNSTAWAQYIKAVSEIGELGDAILKKNLHMTKDGVGDTLVCLINVCAILGIDMTECLQQAFDEIKDRRGFLNKDGVFIKDM